MRTELSKQDHSVTFTIKHDGFDRISKMKVAHERTFRFEADSLEIEDRLTGDGTCKLRLCFHYAPGVGAPENKGAHLAFEKLGATFHVDKRFNSRVVSGERKSPVGGLFSPEYGVAVQCTTFNVDAVIELPANIKNQLIFDL